MMSFRFDTIFIVKDEHNEARDITLAKHVMSIHVNAGSAAAADAAAQDEGELSLQVRQTKKHSTWSTRWRASNELAPIRWPTYLL